MEFESVQFITPITPWGQIGGGSEKEQGNNEASLFSNIFHNVVDQVYATQADVENKQYLLATGQLDDVHSLPIAEAKASLSVDILISLRNKALESYDELMKINL